MKGSSFICPFSTTHIILENKYDKAVSSRTGRARSAVSCAADVSCLAAAGIFRSKCVRELNFDEASLPSSLPPFLSLPLRPLQLSVRGMESRLQHQAIIVRGEQAKIKVLYRLWEQLRLHR